MTARPETDDGQVRGYMPPSQTTDWATPKDLFDALDAEFGPFDLDPCGSPEHHYSAFRVRNAGGYFYDGTTPALDGLAQPWKCGAAFMNPPQDKLRKWIEKASGEVLNGNAGRVVALIPARTDTKAWQAHILKEAAFDRMAAPDHVHLVRFLAGRVRFGNGKGPAPFPSAIVVWER